MINRYKTRAVAKNDVDLYEETFRRHGVKYIRQFVTPNFRFPTKDEMKKFQTIKHVWTQGDKYYKLANEYYGDSRDWWIIAKYNLKPTESHVQLGDIIEIPFPLTNLLNYMLG